jgi:hypothetical protein
VETTVRQAWSVVSAVASGPQSIKFFGALFARQCKSTAILIKKTKDGKEVIEFKSKKAVWEGGLPLPQTAHLQWICTKIQRVSWPQGYFIIRPMF